MTTIAWDGKFLAADSQETTDGIALKCTEPKIRKIGDVFVACAGDSGTIAEFERWVEGGRLEEDTPSLDEKESFAAFVLEKSGKMVSYEEEMKPFVVPIPYAIGSGWKAALTLMVSGMSSVEAIETICDKRLDVYTSGPVQVVEIPPRKQKRKI